MATGAVTASAASGSSTGMGTGTGLATEATATSGSGSGSGLSFRTLLSDINPLQYIPVVGAVYRAVTGDEGNSTLRFVASLGTSFALGGPLGVGITVAEKITGIDPERIARSLLGRLLHHGAAPATQAAAGTATGAIATATTTAGGEATPTVTAATATADGTDAANRPWSAAELSAYAQTSGATLDSGKPGGTRIANGAVSADMLNAMELKRVSALYA